MGYNYGFGNILFYGLECIPVIAKLGLLRTFQQTRMNGLKIV